MPAAARPPPPLVAACFLGLGLGMAAARGVHQVPPSRGDEVRESTTSRSFVYRTVGGCPLHLELHRPTGARLAPALLWIHGGALMMGARGDLAPEQRDLYLDAGLAVIALQYRLAPEVRLGGIREDLLAAWRWIQREGRAQLHVDPGRVAVVGHSAGGYLALTAGALLAPRPRAVVSFYGYGDIAGAWLTRPSPHYLREEPRRAEAALRRRLGSPLACTPSDDDAKWGLYVHWRQTGRWPLEVTGQDPQTHPAAFEPWCPERQVSPRFPPTLLLHGTRDRDVPYAQSVAMQAALQRQGVASRLLTLPGRGHGFDSEPGLAARDVRAAFRQVLEFLQENLQGAGDEDEVAPEAPGAGRDPR